MASIPVIITVTPDRRVIAEIPDYVPAGTFTTTLQFDDEPQPVSDYEWAKAILQKAGALSTLHIPVGESRRLTVEERTRIGTMPPDARPSEELIAEMRG